MCVRERGNSEERIQIRRKLKKIEEEEEEKRKEEGLSFFRENSCCSINIDSSVVSSVFNNVIITTCMCTLGLYNRANGSKTRAFSNDQIDENASRTHHIHTVSRSCEYACGLSNYQLE